MALSAKRACLRGAGLQASPAIVPKCVPRGITRSPVTVRSSSKDEAVKALEQFSKEVRSGLVGQEQITQVTVTPLTAKSSDSTSSMDGGLLELNKDSFWPYLNQQGSTLVVVDFYTDWCGPCKMIYPELVKLAAERTDIRIVKLNCNKANKEIGVQLGIKVAPTFHLYRSGSKVGEMTGAKMDKLLGLINEQQAARN